MNDAVNLSADRLRQACGGTVPRCAVLLGSGWTVLGDALQEQAALDYAALPAFPALGVAGHVGRVRAGTLGGVPVLLLSGRKHTYEDGDAAAMKGAIRTLAAAGVTTLLQTNAAGSLDPAMPPGALMLVEDHLNIVQRSPLHGEPGNGRFVDMAAAYHPALRTAALQAAADIGLRLHSGVYAWVLGPQFETPAEIRMLQRLGAQAVGMSTVPETILARHAGLKVLALSMITNMGCGLSSEQLSHAHTLASAQAASADALRLVEALLPRIESLT
ncbi:MAG: purine-nucleoside phosphorylase [Rubrivivax sp.]|nr:purine-nucleoside phosphorylase [Rubrivivax sp.]